jgi:hypothetical protein
MPDYALRLGASKSVSSLIVLYVPTKDRLDLETEGGTSHG